MRFSQQSVGITAAPTATVLPGTWDVLFGRGRTIHLHPGNQRFHAIVQRFKHSYQNALRRNKAEIAHAAIHAVVHDHDEGTEEVRFLIRLSTEFCDEAKPPVWTLASEEEIFQKVQHVLRDNRSPSSAHALSPVGVLGSPTDVRAANHNMCMVLLVPMPSLEPSGGWALNQPSDLSSSPHLFGTDAMGPADIFGAMDQPTQHGETWWDAHPSDQRDDHETSAWLDTLERQRSSDREQPSRADSLTTSMSDIALDLLWSSVSDDAKATDHLEACQD